MALTRTEAKRVVLAGFMGSGKSTVGRLLAERLAWRFADLDDAVASQKGLSVPEIFAQCGEPAFRTAEAEALADLLKQENVVIALGGGAPATPVVQRLLAETSQSVIVQLHADFDILEERCRRQAQEPGATARPLLRDTVGARFRYQQRAPLYAALAHHTVDVSTAGPEAVVEEILAALPAPSNS